jgi:predicted DNA-binding transcriptional regulator AlpA
MDKDQNLIENLKTLFGGLINPAIQDGFEKLSSELFSSSSQNVDIIFIEEAMRITGLARQTIYQLVGENKIPYLPKNGRKKLAFSRKALVEWREGRK